ncbi:hypothetical protein F5876DRAFT_69019 [Lentinula aff. lateritia]|uniref:Uncharacterized protein n=1 Tax=Lentinula aff. lateritia TaxID=2804960 RepID=A0ACC1TPD8_9AGAR|nr:hypothetical protein F5876DRAFT_69019 [Lentinula aff. lateritia]
MAIGYVSAIRNLEVIKFTNLAAGTVIIYDHLLTLNDEFEHIWKNSWSMGKALFIINRYYSLIATIVINNYGFQYFHWEGGGGLITCIITETILLMRLYAMYALDKRMLSLMLVGFVLSIASQGAVVGVALKNVRAYKDTETLLCVPLLPTFSYSFWIPRLAFETVLCILALIRGFQLQKDEIGETDWSGNDLMRILIRDSIGYYIVMFAIYLMCLVVWITNIDLAGISFGISVAFLKATYSKRDQLSTSIARGVEADLLYAPSVE